MNNDIGKNIKKYRTEKKFSREELSKELEISIHTLAKYEQGQRQPNIDTIKKISIALDIPLIDILGHGDNFNSIPQTKDHEEIVRGVYNSASLDELIYSNSELIAQQKENILYSMREIAKASKIKLEKTYHFEKLPFDYDEDKEKQFVDITYKDKVFSLTEEEYYKLAERIIESVAINILASRDY